MLQYKYSFLLLLAATLAFTACEETKYDIETYSGENFYRFVGSALTAFESDVEPVEIPVVFSTGTGASGSVDFTITGGAAGADYTVLNTGSSLTFNAGNGYRDVIRIQPINNAANPNDVALQINLSNPQGGVIGFPGPANNNTALFTLNLLNACGESMLQGTYDYVSSESWCGSTANGTVDIIALGSGRYTFSDWSFGTYPACYGGTADSWGTLNLVDVCNKVAYEGADNYGDIWSITDLSVDGANLTFSWINTYNEGGTVTLTRTDGSSWPDLSI